MVVVVVEGRGVTGRRGEGKGSYIEEGNEGRKWSMLYQSLLKCKKNSVPHVDWPVA